MRQLVLALIIVAVTNTGAIANEFAGAGIAAGGAPSSVLDEYIIDDGTQENQIGLTDGGRLIWLNSYTVLAGRETITQVRVAWGENPAGLPGRVMIWRDPNNDGNPHDVTFMSGVTSATIVSSAGDGTNNSIATYAVPPTVIGIAGDRFFVGVCIDHSSGQFPAALDQTAPNNGRSWVGGGGTTFNCLDPNTGTMGPMLNVDDIGLAGDWMIRGTATAAVPVMESSWGSIKARYTE